MVYFGLKFDDVIVFFIKRLLGFLEIIDVGKNYFWFEIVNFSIRLMVCMNYFVKKDE